MPDSIEKSIVFIAVLFCLSVKACQDGGTPNPELWSPSQQNNLMYDILSVSSENHASPNWMNDYLKKMDWIICKMFSNTIANSSRLNNILFGQQGQKSKSSSWKADCLEICGFHMRTLSWHCQNNNGLLREMSLIWLQHTRRCMFMTVSLI